MLLTFLLVNNLFLGTTIFDRTFGSLSIRLHTAASVPRDWLNCTTIVLPSTNGGDVDKTRIEFQTWRGPEIMFVARIHAGRQSAL